VNDKQIHIAGGVLADLIAHAREEAPLECCGLLLGAGTLIDECVRSHNLNASETTFLVDPAEHFAALRRVRRERREILGAYHSHPRSPAVPSRTDLEQASYPEFVYVIVSLAYPEAPDVRAYFLDNGRFVAATIVIVPDAPTPVD
jgi:[CysO sulfur-carrier protein]-S-L-cysteine hydrolase